MSLNNWREERCRVASFFLDVSLLSYGGTQDEQSPSLDDCLKLLKVSREFVERVICSSIESVCCSLKFDCSSIFDCR